MKEYMPYIATVVCAMISGFASYFAARKQSNADMKKLEKQYELDIEKEREKFAMEKQKMELEHKCQLELMQKEMENSLGTSITNTMFAEIMKTPEVRQQISQGVRKGTKKKR